MTKPYSIIPAELEHANAIEFVLDEAFGLDRHTKASYRLREGSMAADGLSFVATSGDTLVGTVQFWPIVIGGDVSALLLGPLAVLPARQGEGIGLDLIATGMVEAKSRDHSLVVLVGDEPYYAKAGFRRFAGDAVSMPGPYDPARLLHAELKEGAADGASGLILPPHRLRAAV